MIIIVCGGRKFMDADLFDSAMRTINENVEITKVVHGACTGADTLAQAWADVMCVSCIDHPADWLTYGKAAGPIRNKEMITDHHPDLVIAFPGGRGTENMKRLGRQHNITVIEVDKDEDNELLLKEF